MSELGDRIETTNLVKIQNKDDPLRIFLKIKLKEDMMSSYFRFFLEK